MRMCRCIAKTLSSQRSSCEDVYKRQAQKAQRRLYFTVWTRFELEKAESKMAGAKDARLKLSYAKSCTPDEARAVVAVRKEFGELVRKMAVTDVDYNTEASVIDGTASGVTVEPEPSVPF